MNESSSSTASRDRALPWAFMGVVLVVGALNLLYPRAYTIFGFHHLSYLPLPIQFVWIALAACALYAVGQSKKEIRPHAAVLIVFALLVVASFFVFRTTFPMFHGDGAMGGLPRPGPTPSLSAYPHINGRLQAFLSYGLSKWIPKGSGFNFHICDLNQNPAVNNASIFVTILGGILVVIACTCAVFRLPGSNTTRQGLLLMLLCAAPMLNAYGHFDSYMISIACVYLWLLAMYVLHHAKRKALPALFVVVMLALSYWAHPILAILTGFSGLYLLLALVHRHRKNVPVLAPILFAVAIAFVPYFLKGRGSRDLYAPESIAIFKWFWHEKLMSSMQVGLPAMVLATVVLARDRNTWRRPSLFQAFSLLVLLATVFLFLTLHLGFGLQDEFIYGLFGVLLLGTAVFLFLSSNVDRRSALYGGILSLFLFVPMMIVYSNGLIVDRFEDTMPHDRCGAHRSCSPYRLLAQMMPLDTPEYRERRLAILETGINNPAPHLARFKDENLASYAAWCFEFRELDRGYVALEYLLDTHSPYLEFLWDANGALHTTRGHNVAPWISRELSRQIIDARLAAHPDDEAMQGMSDYLRHLEETEPSPLGVLRGGIGDLSADDWLGVYRFTETGAPDSGIAVVYRVEFKREGDALVADVDVDGFQSMERLRCRTQRAGQVISLYFESYREGHRLASYEEGDQLLTFEKDGERLRMYWGALKPRLGPSSPDGAVFSRENASAGNRTE